MPATVDFYFDYLSPFAYLAARELPELARAAGAEVRYRPILFAAVLDHWGQRGPAEIPPKALHTYKECLRYAVVRGIPLRAPRLHPFNPLLSLRVTWAAAEAERARVCAALYDLVWARGGDLTSEAEVGAALTAAELPAAALIARAQAPEIKARLRDETAAAIARGVFGVPTMIVGDELYWGVSQLDHVAQHLAGRDPLAGLDWRSYVPDGAGATRRRKPI
jgi:2-hydroxychromene-2-carboxylate isomerase